MLKIINYLYKRLFFKIRNGISFMIEIIEFRGVIDYYKLL